MFTVVKYLDLNMSKCMISTLIQIVTGAIIYLGSLCLFKFQFLFDIINQVFCSFRRKGVNSLWNRKKRKF